MNDRPDLMILARRVAAFLLLLVGVATTIATSPPPCNMDTDCGEGSVCIEGDCHSACASDDDCFEFAYCTQEETCESLYSGGEERSVAAADDAQMGPEQVELSFTVTVVFPNDPPSRAGGRLNLGFAADLARPIDSSWTVSLSEGNLQEEHQVLLERQGTVLTALWFEVDTNQACFDEGGCELEFTLTQDSGPAVAVDVTIDASIHLSTVTPEGTTISIEVHR